MTEPSGPPARARRRRARHGAPENVEQLVDLALDRRRPPRPRRRDGRRAFRQGRGGPCGPDAARTARRRRPDRARHRPDGAGHQRAVRRGRPGSVPQLGLASGLTARGAPGSRTGPRASTPGRRELRRVRRRGSARSADRTERAADHFQRPLDVGHGPHVEDDTRRVLGPHYEFPGRSVRRPFDVVHLVPADDRETAATRIVELVATRIPKRVGFDAVRDT